MKKPKELMKHGKAANGYMQDNTPISIFQNVTTLHGTNHFSHKKGKGLFLWAFLMIANIMLTVIFLLVIKDKYNNDAIVTKVIFICSFVFRTIK